MYDELLAVHTIMRRGADLTVGAFRRLAAGEAVRVAELVRLARWQHTFVCHHHECEDELFWPVLRRLFPDAVAALNELSVEHAALDDELRRLDRAISSLAGTRKLAAGDARAVAARVAAAEGLPAATSVRDVLAQHLDREEPVLAKLLPQVPGADIGRLRAAIVAGAPKSGPDLVFGLLADPERAPGYDVMLGNLPLPVRLLRPVLLRRYRGAKAALSALPAA